MIEQITHRNHVVPKCVSKHFTNADGYLHGFLKDENRYVRRVPKRMFVEEDYYTQTDEQGRQSDKVERALQRLESAAAPVLNQIILTARAGHRPCLEPRERAIWDQFFFTQRKRVPDQHRQSGIYDSFESRLRELIADYERAQGSVPVDQKQKLLEPATVQRLMHNARAEAVILHGGPAIPVLAGRGLAVGLVKPGAGAFLLGSFPILKLTPSHTNNLASHDVESWFCIAPDVIVGPGYEAGTESFVTIEDGEIVKALNLEIARQSSVVAGSSRMRVKEVIDLLSEAEIRHGSNAAGTDGRGT